MWVDGAHKFLKIGKPLRNFGEPAQVDQLIADLPLIRDKRYDCLELNCYWHHFDKAGDGTTGVSLDPLNRLIDAILAHGMVPCLSVETYAVGGGQIPPRFWERYPGAAAVDYRGQRVTDTEYGYLSAVPSLYSKDYREVSRAFIRALTSGIDHTHCLWFETTVEPQYMGSNWVDYSDAARTEYAAWLDRNGLSGPAFPDRFPIDDVFLSDPTWNRFRAQWLAEWVNGDAQAYRDIAGQDAIIASDYLDAIEDTTVRRCGDPAEFLRWLTGPNIIQINWTWQNFDRCPNQKAYDRVHAAMAEAGHDWAIAEHMTVNGCDYHAEDMDALLRNTLENGTLLGWEFVDIAPDRDPADVAPNTVVPGNFKPAHFGVYGPNWEPKPHMAVVEDNWRMWQDLVREQAGRTVVAAGAKDASIIQPANREMDAPASAEAAERADR